MCGKMGSDPPRLAQEVLAHYEQGHERDRLSTGYGPLERERTREVLDRHLPPPPAVILDIGGGAGVHALWLAARGYEVHLRDPVPIHIEQAVAASETTGVTLASAALGDARTLDFEEQVAEKGIATGRFDPVPKAGFTRMYFHRPTELRDEVAAADFAVEDLVGLEGIGFAMNDFAERWADPAGREALLEAARRTESVPELLGMSPHLLLVARRGSHSADR